MKLLVRSKDNDAYRIEIDRLAEQVKKDENSEEDIVTLSRPLIAKHLLVDWQGLEDDDGNPLPYDPELAVELFKMNSAIFAKVCFKAEEIQLRNDMAYDETEKK
ncbi:hypothetical protein PSH49_21465 [Pseudoalteromonas sp. GABNS16G]|uniref:hypothetical protein n=1 Tax=unclassified Pseudoalteromonas TaxID=194690 RepID=UPI002358E5E5|nr:MULTISPECIES: hypothetical protein [unclassified Pseudoalteromonas]MDC9603150.1 hypothetical protein [Pseudoalteromonas sp. GABNS16G]MDC9611579.1 hypothetical protein [Pseudoalteromonas sp. GABNS16H]